MLLCTLICSHVLLHGQILLMQLQQFILRTVNKWRSKQKRKDVL